MPEYSETSRRRLITCNPLLQQVFNEVIKYYDCSILCGYRSEKDQLIAYQEDKSKVQWPNSKHNIFPSDAVDVAPYPINWNNIKRFYYFAGFVLGVASQLRINIRFGGDWDGDEDLDDQTFNDLVHFELVME